MGDLIDRQAAIEAIMNHYRVDDEPQNEDMDWCVAMLNDLPTAEPRKGKWMWSETGFKCSECLANGGTLECMTGVYRYCPNCGARMEVE